MKKLIAIVLIITLNSCSTEDINREEPTTQKTAVEEKWIKYPGETEFVFTGTIRPLQLHNSNYSDCEMWAGTTPDHPSNIYSQTNGTETWVIHWRIACR